MEFKKLVSKKGIEIKGLKLLIPNVFNDERGFFLESWNKKSFKHITNLEIEFVQDNHSMSLHGVLRGLHYQLEPASQGKLVRCMSGEIFDVAVDIRKNSETFGEWVGVTLSSNNFKQLWIPAGFAHGFLTISESAEVLYKTDKYWNNKYERSIKWDDEQVDIKWPLEKLKTKNPIISSKDQNSIPFNIAIKDMDFYL